MTKPRNNEEIILRLGRLKDEARERCDCLTRDCNHEADRSDWFHHSMKELVSIFGENSEEVVAFINRDRSGTLRAIDDPEDSLTFAIESYDRDIAYFQELRIAAAESSQPQSDD